VLYQVSVVLALDAGHSAQEVASLLGLDDATVYHYASLYGNEAVENYLKHNWAPYVGKLNVGKLTEEQRQAIYAAVSSYLYTSAKTVAAWIACTFGVHPHEKTCGQVAAQFRFPLQENATCAR
jgi:transposase